MRARLFAPFLLLGLASGVSLRSQPMPAALEAAESGYRERTAAAAEELNRTRARIVAEKAPLLDRIKAAEDRIVAAEREATRFETTQEESAESRRKLLQELDALRKTSNYVTTLARDGLAAAQDGLAPGENQVVGNELSELIGRFEQPNAGRTGASALAAAEFLFASTERALGGYRTPGTATLDATSQSVRGTFAFVGPETFFIAEHGGVAGSVRPRESARFPVSYALAGWAPEDAARFFNGEPATVLVDASGGKALRLQETRGTLREHVSKGGYVAYLIIAVGVVALAMILQKTRDLFGLGVDRPGRVHDVLQKVAAGSFGQAEAAAKNLQRGTRDLLLVGLRHANQPKTIMEERLEATLLGFRLHAERRLPLLAVIATAAPLMGLLGTVVGMVKTFALITVFGTGNAAKLSSGISEVLVATELGLAVAIPTLIAHGLLSHRIQKNLSLLQRYALEFCTAVEISKSSDAQPQEPTAPFLA